MPQVTIYPFADSSQAAGWTHTGNFFYTELDDDPNDGDTSYIQGTSGQQAVLLQRFGLPEGTVINSVTFTAYGRRASTGLRVDEFTLTLGFEASGSSANLVTLSSAPTTFTALEAVATVNPITLAAWLPTEVSLMKVTMGVLQTFSGFPFTPAIGRFTSLKAVVDYNEPTWAFSVPPVVQQ